MFCKHLESFGAPETQVRKGGGALALTWRAPVDVGPVVHEHLCSSWLCSNLEMHQNCSMEPGASPYELLNASLSTHTQTYNFVQGFSGRARKELPKIAGLSVSTNNMILWGH